MLTNQSWKVTGQTNKPGGHIQHPGVVEARSPLSELPHEAELETPRQNNTPLQVRTSADLFTKQSCEVTDPSGQHKKRNGVQHKELKKIFISEIRSREFRKAYRDRETTGVMKFSQKENQIYLRRINITTELAIRNKEERRIRTKPEEDSRKNLVPLEYQDLLPAFEKGEKTDLPPHGAGIDLEITMDKGKGLPDQKIYPLGAEELETVQEYIQTNLDRGWIREAFTDGGSPIIFVKKQDGSLRLGVDYRALNEVTKKRPISTPANWRSTRSPPHGEILYRARHQGSIP